MRKLLLLSSILQLSRLRHREVPHPHSFKSRGRQPELGCECEEDEQCGFETWDLISQISFFPPRALQTLATFRTISVDSQVSKGSPSLLCVLRLPTWPAMTVTLFQGWPKRLPADKQITMSNFEKVTSLFLILIGLSESLIHNSVPFFFVLFSFVFKATESVLGRQVWINEFF